MNEIQKILKDRKTTLQMALSVFDRLEAVDRESMIGRWKGFEICTGHPMEGLLSLSGWYGKLFLNAEAVHPLLCYTRQNRVLYSVNPKLIPMNLKIPKSAIIRVLMKLLKPFLQTRKPKARLRMIEYRNKVTATMCYDEKAIFDHFAAIDENTVMGVMDLKGDFQPYIFVLERDEQTVFDYQF